MTTSSARPPRVLWLSENPLFSSGFGRVTREIVSRIGKGAELEVACLAWGWDGWPDASVNLPCRLYPAQASGFGRENFERVVNDFQPDVVVSLAELWMVDWIHTHPCRGRFKWVAYVPIDSSPLYPPWIPLIQGMDAVVAMAEFGQRVLQEAIPSKRIDVIHHGVDPGIFRPLPERATLKSHDRLRGKFVVGCVARNQPRKNLPALIKSFASIVQRNANLHLYLHTSPFDVVGHDLLTLLRRYRLEGHADICPPDFVAEKGVSDEVLNRIYNLCDITALPTMGEGFGLPILESLAAGTPVVATDYSACQELIRGRGELARVAAMLTMGNSVMEYALVDEEDLGNKILRLAGDPGLLAKYSAAAREFAETLTWDRLTPSWLAVIGRLVGQADGVKVPLPHIGGEVLDGA